jgi:nicotinate-nucleotide adenylyltransferase
MIESVVLFGGSFDPVHAGHLHIAKAVKTKLKARELFFIPAHQNPLKTKRSLSAKIRLRFLKLALTGLPHKISTFELKQKGPSYTVNTLVYFKKRFARRRLYWLVGADAYQTIEQWKSPEKIRSLATIVVVARRGHPIQKNDPRDLVIKIKSSPWSSTKLRQSLKKGQLLGGAFPKPLEKHLKKLLLNGQNPYVSL